MFAYSTEIVSLRDCLQADRYSIYSILLNALPVANVSQSSNISRIESFNLC